MTESDERRLDALKARAWGWPEVQNMRYWALPAWADELLPRRRSIGYGRFLALVLAAYRAGAAGVLLGYHEALAIAEITSQGTWTRWIREMEALGLVRIIQTWKREPADGKRGRPRCYARLLYRLGPAWERVGPGLLEGSDTGQEGPSQALARRCAGRARNVARQARRARCGAAWAQTKHDPRYMRNQGSPIFGDHSPPVQTGGKSARSRLDRELSAEATAKRSPTLPATHPTPSTGTTTSGDREPQSLSCSGTNCLPNCQAIRPSEHRGAPDAPDAPQKPKTAQSKTHAKAPPVCDLDPIETMRRRLIGQARIEPVDPEHVKAVTAALLEEFARRSLPIGRGPPKKNDGDEQGGAS